mgnify:CR=1
MRSELLSGHGNDMHYNVRQVSGKYLINECIIFSSENVSLAKRELFSSSRLSCLGGGGYIKESAGRAPFLCASYIGQPVCKPL